jgi:two-component system, cell cycle sensor histidine kinase and response regulator CckA
MIEDSPADAELIVDALEHGGYDVVSERVESADPMRTALQRTTWDVVLSDYSLPTFSGVAALEVLQASGCDVPFLIVSGTVGEETAVDALRAGAQDFLLKGSLSRLIPAIARGLADVRARQERGRAVDDLRRSEAQYRSLVDRAVFGLYRTNGDGLFLTVNPALIAMLHYDSAEELLRVNLDDIYQDASARQVLLGRLTHERGITGEEVIWRTKTGQLIRVRWSASFIDALNVSAPVYEVFVEDVTERVLLAEQLRQSQKMEAIGQLAGGVAHDFNNLLTAILSHADFALEELAPAHPANQHVAEIRLASESAAALTRQLLAFSRRQVLQLQSLDLNTVVTRVESLLRRIIGEHIALISRLESTLPCVSADPGQIEQILMNLCVNARDAMPAGGQLTIETASVELDAAYVRGHGGVVAGAHVMLAVSDTGTGMDAATQARVFEPFFTTKDRGEGTGLGLATVYGIVKQSRGSIWIYSEVGHGTTFKIYLPCVETTEQVAPPGPRVASAAVHGNETILVADDQRGIRAVIRAALIRYGYTVLLASDGVEALRIVSEHADPIHLLLTDVVMPAMSGCELVSRMRHTHPNVKVLYTSGYTDDAIVRHGILEPDAQFLEKPFTPQALVKRIREVLDTPIDCAVPDVVI